MCTQAGLISGHLTSEMVAAVRSRGPGALYFGFLPYCLEVMSREGREGREVEGRGGEGRGGAARGGGHFVDVYLGVDFLQSRPLHHFPPPPPHPTPPHYPPLVQLNDRITRLCI